MSFATQMVAKLEALLLANPGASSVNVDGVQVSFSDLEKRYTYWKNAAARESGSRPLTSQIKFSG